MSNRINGYRVPKTLKEKMAPCINVCKDSYMKSDREIEYISRFMRFVDISEPIGVRDNYGWREISASNDALTQDWVEEFERIIFPYLHKEEVDKEISHLSGLGMSQAYEYWNKNEAQLRKLGFRENENWSMWTETQIWEGAFPERSLTNIINKGWSKTIQHPIC